MEYRIWDVESGDCESAKEAKREPPHPAHFNELENLLFQYALSSQCGSADHAGVVAQFCSFDFENVSHGG